MRERQRSIGVEGSAPDRWEGLYGDKSEESEPEVIFQRILERADQRIEESLKQEGHLPREEELSLEEFRSINQRLRNIKEEWEPALEKGYNEVEKEDLESLRSLIEKVSNLLRFELKADRYTELLYLQLEELELDEEMIFKLRNLSEDEESQDEKVGSHLSQVNIDFGEMEREVTSEIVDDVSERIEEEMSDLKNDLKRNTDFKVVYRGYLEILEAIEKELDAIERYIDEEPVIEELAYTHRELQECISLAEEVIRRKQTIEERLNIEEGLKDTVSKIFYSGLIN